MKILKLEILKPVYAVSLLSDGVEPGTLIRYRSEISVEARDGSILNVFSPCEIGYVEKMKTCGAYIDFVKAVKAEVKYEALKALNKYEAERRGALKCLSNTE